jgi:hypothetical protein
LSKHSKEVRREQELIDKDVRRQMDYLESEDARIERQRLAEEERKERERLAEEERKRPHVYEDERYAKEGSNRYVQPETPVMAPTNREQLGRYARGQGRGASIRMGSGVIEDTMAKRDPGSRLLSRDPLP